MYFSKLLSSGVVLGVFLTSSVAYAGFQWGGDVRVQQADSDPVEKVMMEELEPVLEPVQEIKPEDLPVEIAMRTEKKEMDVVEGFGNDVPLSYAMVSIVPPSYGSGFGADVNPAELISWKGGKPWDQVLQDAVAEKGLSVHVEGQKVSVQKASYKPVEKMTSSKLKVITTSDADSDTVAVVKEPVGREVFVRRHGGHVDVVHQEVVAEETVAPVDLMEGASMDVVETVSEPSQDIMAVQETVEQEEAPEMIEKINPDIPVEVASYQGGHDENVFEMVMAKNAPAQVLDTKKISSFHAKSGQTVRSVIEKWSSEANVQVYWETPYDFPVEKSMALTATYPMAVQALLGRYEDIDPRPTVKLHPNWPHGPSILTVK